MFIPEFWVGVATVLFAEFAIILVIAFAKSIGNEHRNKK